MRVNLGEPGFEHKETIKSGVKIILKTVSMFGRFRRILYPPLPV